MLSAADFRRSAVLFVRRCGQTRRSCCINQLVSPRAVLVNGALARLFYDVTGDRPTIKRTHKKRNTPIRYAPLKKTLNRRIGRPSSAQNGAERNGRAESARLINIGQSERSVLGHAHSKPASYRARPMRSGRVCGCQAVVPSKSTVIMPNPFRLKRCFYYNRFQSVCQEQSAKNARSGILRRSMRSRKRLSDSSMPIQRAIANAAETAVKRTFEARSGLQLPRQADEAHLRNHTTDAAPPFASVFHGIPSLSAQKISLCDRIYPLASHVNAAETAV